MSFVIRVTTECSSSAFPAPLFLKTINQPHIILFDNAIASADAIVSALVFSTCPLPSCVSGANTGIPIIFKEQGKDTGGYFIFFYITPQNHNQFPLPVFLQQVLYWHQRRLNTMALFPLDCNWATIFLFTSPPYTMVTRSMVAASVIRRPFI